MSRHVRPDGPGDAVEDQDHNAFSDDDPRQSLLGLKSVFARPQRHRRRVSARRLALYTLTAVLTIAAAVVACPVFKVPHEAVFVLNYVASLSLAAILNATSDVLSKILGPPGGELINTILANIVPLIIGSVALVLNDLESIRTIIIGSILTNMLLVLGLLFFVGGIRQNKTIVSPDSITTSIHVISIAILLLSVLLRPLASPSTTEPSSSPTKCLTLSLTTSVFLLVLFATYIFLRLRAPTSPPKSLEDISDHIERCGPQGGSPTSRPRIPSASTFTTLSPTPTLLPSQSFSSISRLQPILTALLFATSSFLFTLCAYTLFSIVTDPTSSHILPHRFTTAVLLPLLAQPLRIFHGLYTVLHDHSLEIATATVATSNVTLALFDLPILSLAGWIFKHNDVLVPSHGRKAGLADDVYDGAVLLVAVVVAGFVVKKGWSSWLDGALFLGLYGMIGLGFWVRVSESP